MTHLISGSCPHTAALAGSLGPPSPSTFVHKDECTQCFDTSQTEVGIDVCLSCFNGGCADSTKHHARTHAERRKHPLAVNVIRRRRSKQERDVGEPPLKKLAIIQERQEDLYDVQTRVRCYGDGCGGRFLAGDPPQTLQLEPIVAAIEKSMASAQMSEVRDWEEEIEMCPHATILEQVPSGTVSQLGSTCAECSLGTNLWLCLVCGHIGCGRQQYGGSGGNGHGLQHFQRSGHAINVKLGTISPEGSADVYCYTCNDAKIDPKLTEHLSTFGIRIAEQQKTEQSMTELQIEHNLRFDFAMTGEDGKDLEPLFGPGLTGLRNLGNSCYINSVVQTLFTLPSFRARFLPPFATHPEVCSARDAATCMDCQMNKLAHGLLSGRYALPSTFTEVAPGQPVFQDGIKPFMLKNLLGKGHVEFRTMRQQDADEFLRHILMRLQRHAQPNSAHDSPIEEGDPSSPLGFALEQRLQCSACNGVRYSQEVQNVLSLPVPAVLSPETSDGGDHRKTFQRVPLEDCFHRLVQREEVEYQCPACQKKTAAHIATKFATLPQFLFIHARRFELVNWVPTKLEVPIVIDKNSITLDPFVSSGKTSDEVQLPEDASPDAPPPVIVNAEALESLESMGFPAVRAHKGLLATGNSDVEAAMLWILEHSDDPDIDAPPIDRKTSTPLDPSAISALEDMGFERRHAEKGLAETAGNMERAIEWLFNHPVEAVFNGIEPSPGPTNPISNLPGTSAIPALYNLKAFISHKGPSVHSGHYVAHIEHGTTDPTWVLFNDEKVVKADAGAQSAEKLAPFAYLYLFERQ